MIYVRYLLLSFCFLLFSCEKFSENTTVNQVTDNSDTTTAGRIIGVWKLQEQNSDPGKTLNYIFYANKICNIYRGRNELDISPHALTYELTQNNGINTVVITDDMNRKTVFRINSMDDSKMKIVFDMIDNTKQRVIKELTLIKNKPSEGY